MDYIENHNKLFDEGSVSFFMGMNQFGDMTHQEFLNILKLKKDVNVPVMQNDGMMRDIPPQFDWRDKGVINSVSDQGQCGSAIVYGEGHAVMGALSIAANRLISFDLMQVAACLQAGCDGGMLWSLYDYVIKCGIPEKNYPYDAGCQYDPKTSDPAISSFISISNGDENLLANNLYSLGPHSVAIDASRSSFQFYSGGIYYDPGCSTSMLDHEMLLVGYGLDSSNNKYWIVQNSWGSNWGISGYILMSRNRNNNCGIASDAAVPILGNSTFNPDQTCYGN